MLISKEAESEVIEKTGLIHRVYLPENRSKKNPLVVLVHGRAGDANVMWIFSKALVDLRPVIVSPQAVIRDQEMQGFNWWDITLGNQLSDEEKIKGIFAVAEKMEKFIEECHQVYGTNPEETYIAGFSQGGAVASCVGLIKPNFFKGVALLSSFIPVTLTNNLDRIAPLARKAGNLTKYFLFHGTKDDIIGFERARQTKQFLEGIGVDCDLHSDDVAHKVSSTGIKALKGWFEGMMG